MTASGAERGRGWRGLLPIIGAFGLGVLLLALFLALAGFDVTAALVALWRGAFGSWSAIASATLVRAVPLILLGLGFTLGVRAGALNIGMEGQFALGAITATAVGVHANGMSPLIAIPMVLAAGAIAGAAWVLLPVVMRLRLGVTEVITTLLLNFLADAAVSYAVLGPLQEPLHIYPQSAGIAAAARLPRLLPGERLHLGLPIVLGVALLLALLLSRTRWGFRLRAVGANPVAARISGGIAASGVFASALLWSGALAGLGGAIEVSGVSFALYPNLSPGYGFTAIAVALLGRLQPLGVVIAGLLFGALEAGAGAMQRDAGIPAVAVQVVEAVAILTLVVLARRERSSS
ncbi:MAG: ABC transporter permease [Gemmatimonadota bacterium]